MNVILLTIFKSSIIKISVLSFILIPIYGCNKSQEIDCSDWMAGTHSIDEVFNTNKNIINACDNTTFKVLNYEYAKDNNFVYYKFMPNAWDLTVIVAKADPKTFKIIKECPGMGFDKNNVYSLGKIDKNKDPNKLKKHEFCY